MKTPRNLTFASVLVRKWNYVQVHQEGSHIILDTEIPSAQRISVPAHKPLKIGTLNVLLRLVSEHKGVSKHDILDSR